MTELGSEAKSGDHAPAGREPSGALPDEVGKAVQHFVAQAADKREALVALHDIVHGEQDVYWSRFAAFAALEAGLLVLTSGDTTAKAVGNIGGFLLAALWLWIQYKSRGYVDRGKRYYHRLRRELGIWWVEELKAVGKPWDQAMQNFAADVPVADGRSSTDLALFVPAALLAMWVVLALPDSARQWLLRLVCG